jgi:hypothetical protein
MFLNLGGVLNEMSKNIANKINGTGSTLQLALFSAVNITFTI